MTSYSIAHLEIMIREIKNKIIEEPNEHGIYSTQTAENIKTRYDFKNCKIALVDADLLDGGTRHPNLCIMKLSGYFKEHGCQVRLIEDYSELYKKVGELDDLNTYDGVENYDAIYICKVFDFTKIDRRLLNFENVYFGGTGFYFDHAPKLPEKIEHHMPDYHVYDHFIEQDTRYKNKYKWYKDYLYFSIGFVTRGCFRHCDFCVNHDCKQVKFHSHIEEWYDPSRKYIYCWDDNFFGYPKWKEALSELIATGKPFQFKQGLDMRLMTPEKAKLLNQAKYFGDYIFAFDHIEDAVWMEKKLQMWREFCDKPTKLYVLSGFDRQDEQEIESVFERIRILIKYDCLPYIMRHEKYLQSPYKSLFIQIARWCNQPQFIKKLSFRQYCTRCQYHVKTETICTAYRAMLEFEEKFPNIAAKYYDMEYLKHPYVIKIKEQKAAAARKRKEESQKKRKSRKEINKI